MIVSLGFRVHARIEAVLVRSYLRSIDLWRYLGGYFLAGRSMHFIPVTNSPKIACSHLHFSRSVHLYLLRTLVVVILSVSVDPVLRVVSLSLVLKSV